MTKTSTDRLKINSQLGRMPVLQFLPPAELAIDDSYQRSIESGDSRALIRRIAQHWNWDLCLPLVVSRRRTETGDAYFVIDGQHRLEASKLRGDIGQLPCVVVEYAGAADEAASFVHLNQQRRPLKPIDLFKAALASGDSEARAIMAAMDDAGLSLITQNNADRWKPGQIGIIGGIQRSWRREGAAVTGEAMQLLSTAFADTVLRYAGTIWPGLVSVCAEVMRGGKDFPPGSFASLSAKLGAKGQERLRSAILARSAIDPDLGQSEAARKIIAELHWPERAKQIAQSPVARATTPKAAFAFQPDAIGRDPLDGDGMAWCEQCDMRIGAEQAAGCKSRWCSLRKVAA